MRSSEGLSKRLSFHTTLFYGNEADPTSPSCSGAGVSTQPCSTETPTKTPTNTPTNTPSFHTILFYGNGEKERISVFRGNVFPHNPVLRKLDDDTYIFDKVVIFPHNPVLRKHGSSGRTSKSRMWVSTQSCPTETWRMGG